MLLVSKIRNTYLLISLLIVFLLLNSCNQQDKTIDSALETLQFNIDSTLLNPVFQNSDLEFQFCPPKNWRQMPKDSVQLVQQSLSQMTLPQEKLQVQEVFLNATEKSFVALSIFENPDDKLIDYTLKNYKEIFNKNNTWLDIKQSSFKINDIIAHQFLLTNKDWVSFKLILTEPRTSPLQIDYTVPFATYINKIKTLESSMGSIKLLTHN